MKKKDLRSKEWFDNPKDPGLTALYLERYLNYGLKKKDLKYNKRGKIVSRKASRTAKKANRLVKAGYVTKKGVFGVTKMGGNLNHKFSVRRLYKSNY